MPFDCEPDRWRDFDEPPKKLTFWERVREVLYVVGACFPGFVFLAGTALIGVSPFLAFFLPETALATAAAGLGCWIFFVVIFVFEHDFNIRIFPG